MEKLTQQIEGQSKYLTAQILSKKTRIDALSGDLRAEILESRGRDIKAENEKEIRQMAAKVEQAVDALEEELAFWNDPLNVTVAALQEIPADASDSILTAGLQHLSDAQIKNLTRLVTKPGAALAIFFETKRRQAVDPDLKVAVFDKMRTWTPTKKIENIKNSMRNGLNALIGFHGFYMKPADVATKKLEIGHRLAGLERK